MFLGDVNVAGLTPGDAAQALEADLKAKHLMLHPQVTITVEQYATQNVYVMGQVKNPGSYALATPQSIVAVLALAGGLTDMSDRHITVERHSQPSEKASYFLSNDSQSALSSDVVVYPGDTVLVPKAGIVYVLGDVGRPGGYPITTNDSRISVLQALAMAGSANKTSVLSRAKLIRRSGNGLQELPLALAQIEKGNQPDIEMQSDDVLFIPSSWIKNLSMNASSIAASATSAMIYAHP
jgi:polysaccharide export outer membrane protein